MKDAKRCPQGTVVVCGALFALISRVADGEQVEVPQPVQPQSAPNCCKIIEDSYQRALLTVEDETSSTIGVNLNNPGSEILAFLEADVMECDNIVGTANALRTANWRELGENTTPASQRLIPKFTMEGIDESARFEFLELVADYVIQTGELNEALKAAEDLVQILNLKCDAIVSEVLHFVQLKGVRSKTMADELRSYGTAQEDKDSEEDDKEDGDEDE
ncbi:hypothetical protein F4680DRAFT_452671 [Xylaria scruposa]|nr:hypothetical protein F4680DRAFT_452671 [Xylaria scruposa]